VTHPLKIADSHRVVSAIAVLLVLTVRLVA